MVHVESLSSVANNGFQQLWLKIQTRYCKSFLLNTVFRPPSTPVNFLDNFTRVFIDYLLSDRDIFIIGDLNCNLLGNDHEAKALLEFCTTFNLTQLINLPTRVTENSQSWIDVTMTSNKELVTSGGVLTSSMSDHNLIYSLLNSNIPRAKPSYVSVRSYRNYSPQNFQEDLLFVPFHIVNFFDDEVSDQVEVYSILFLDVLNEHAPIKRINESETKPVCHARNHAADENT